ncbi:LEA type 2 family protein [Pseudomonas sp.]|uniref:LEA type 2 family protein n=1 Tax=Pseudomonas sp. TaxID=306 RepID=UPI003CC6A746
MRRFLLPALRHYLLLMLVVGLNACALLPPQDPINSNVVGIEPLQGQDLEVRFAVKIRLQNPNEDSYTYNGVALNLDVNGRPLASGVSNESGTLGRFSETIVTVPVSVTAFSVLRQTLGLSQTQSLDNLPYELHGKLSNGVFGTVRFSDSGNLSLAPVAGDSTAQPAANPYRNTRWPAATP